MHVKVLKGQQSRLSQGDIIRDVNHIEYVDEESGNIEVSKIVFPLAVVLTQDCDLMQDYRFRWSRQKTSGEDKHLLSVLVAPLYNAEHVYTGTHLEEIGMTMQTIPRTKTKGKMLRNNEIPRFHYVEFPADVAIVPSVIDFKHYFSLNVPYLKKLKPRNFVCRLSVLYREDVSQRFASFLARIALP